MSNKLLCVYCGLCQKSNIYVAPMVDLAMRLFIGWVFWKSGMTKFNGIDQAIFLFEYEYNVPLLSPDIAAYLAMSAELALPVLLWLGLGTRLAAAGLAIMTLVIEVFVYPNTTEHYYWLLILASLWFRGGGALSLDYLISRRLVNSQSN
ncbi:DoxX family protein [Zooshikella ganghwensis]|uniref:DoxX family protein n=1 Tax=Zooshikella ganghwensis TaxID=202772 RepID=A0A4V1INK5_9GAMM|nr:DoxX family protein [Zooshikella ganghwensis]RDH44051.1 DoxX family protein [Zooshikella ganghwensis]